VRVSDAEDRREEAECQREDCCSPWERGTNENTNGLIWEYFKKGQKLPATTAQAHHISHMLSR
jgi:IS30 family transposase